MFVVPNQVGLSYTTLVVMRYAYNQSSLALAGEAFSPSARLFPSSSRDRLADVREKLVKIATILRPHFDFLGDRFSERSEKTAEGSLLTQAEKRLRRRRRAYECQYPEAIAA